MQIYTSAGWSERDAAESILEKNLYGLDIDDRAGQLAYFAVMMKARKYSRRILTKNIRPNVYSIQESNNITVDAWWRFGPEEDIARRLVHDLTDAKEYGSILNLSVTTEELQALRKRLDDIEEMSDLGNLLDMMQSDEITRQFYPLVELAEVMVQKYDIVVTNPPYMGGTMGNKLLDFIKCEYPLSKSDMYSVFIEKCLNLSNCMTAMITPESWMFLSTYIDLREAIFSTSHFVNCLHLGLKAFDCGFGTSAYIIRIISCTIYNSIYVRLVDVETETKPQRVYDLSLRYYSTIKKFSLLPNRIMAYWCADTFAQRIASALQFGKKYDLCPGIKTGNNDLFLRKWYEVLRNKTCMNPSLDTLNSHEFKWYLYNKGGGYNKWYGGYEYVVDFENNAERIKSEISKDTYRLRNENDYFVAGIIWPMVGYDIFSARYLPNTVLSDIASNAIYFHDDFGFKALGFMNTSVFNYILNMINPTVNYPIDSIYNVPLIEPDLLFDSIVEQNIQEARVDWDSYETSWDFKKNPLI